MNVSLRPASAPRARGSARSRNAKIDQIGDALLFGICVVAALLVFVLILEIAYQVIHGAHLAISTFGIGFLGHQAWVANFGHFGAATLIYGTVVTSAMALAIAVPVGVAIGLYLALLAPGGVRGVIGSLVEMLAAIPSVILGLWGIIVLGPVLRDHLEPFLHGVLGFLPIFGPAQTSGTGVFTAGLILSIMVLPIVASVSRDLFLTVPGDLQDGAAALGATRWEVVRGVVLPSTAPGIAAVAFLGLGRALGEAIAVTQVVGGGSAINTSLFKTGDTMASRIAEQFAGALTKLHTASLFYLAVILLVFGLASNLASSLITRRFEQGLGK